MRLLQRPSVLLAVAAVLVGLSGCGSSDSEDSGADGTASTAVESDASTEGAGDTPDTESDSDDTGDDTREPAGEVGSGVVTVDDVEYGDFVGDCSVSRGLDPDTYEPVEVGDLSEPGLTVVVGIDNVESSPEVMANFIMTSEERYRMAGIGDDGTIDSIAYVGSGPSGDVAEVAFSGTSESGESVVAEVVCEIGLG